MKHESARADAPIFAKGSSNVEFFPSVAPRESETVVGKRYSNTFHDTNLKAFLGAAGVREVVVIGVMGHMCLDPASRATFDLGYSVTVAHDACATRDLKFGGVTVAATDVQTAFMNALAFVHAKVVSTGRAFGLPTRLPDRAGTWTRAFLAHSQEAT